jgi:hypothetical protein
MPGPTALAAAAEQAFVVGYPLLVSARASALARNRLTCIAEGPDTLRISGWLDLGHEPIVLGTPDTHGRYYALSLRDAWNTVFASIGARTTGTKTRAFALLGPGRHGEHLPPGVTPVASPTRIVHVTGCLEAHVSRAGASAFSDFRLTPLSRWGGGSGVPPTAGEVARPAAAAGIDALSARACFTELIELLADNPPEPADRKCLLDLLAVAPLDAPDGWSRLFPDARAAIEHGVRRGRRSIRATAARPRGEAVGVWRVVYDQGRFGTDWLRRAALSAAGEHAEPSTDELRAFADAEADGPPLSGQHRYVLHFPHSAHPPVNGFWSLIARPHPPAPADRRPRRTGDLHGLTIDGDGSLSVHIQADRPVRAREPNWLPAPRGRFSLELRLYWPRDEALDGRWTPPAVQRVDQCTPLPFGGDPER